MERIKKSDLNAFPLTGFNFQPFRFSVLPEDCFLETSTLRLEAPPGRVDSDADIKGISPWSEANYSTLRTIICGSERKLRVKQFSYDWAPMANGMPCLWDSDDSSPILIHDRVAWIGTDYQEHRGATLYSHGTLLEFSVYEGVFSDEELYSIMNGIEVIPLHESVYNFLTLSYFERNYWVRYKFQGLRVPHGLYEKNIRHYFNFSELLTFEDCNQFNSRFEYHIELFEFDAAIEIKSDERHEIEIVYRLNSLHCDYLWFHIELLKNETPKLPLPSDSHPISLAESYDYTDFHVYFASNNEQFGGHEAHWMESGNLVMVWCNSMPNFNFSQFKQLIKHFLIKNL